MLFAFLCFRNLIISRDVSKRNCKERKKGENAKWKPLEAFEEFSLWKKLQNFTFKWWFQKATRLTSIKTKKMIEIRNSKVFSRLNTRDVRAHLKGLNFLISTINLMRDEIFLTIWWILKIFIVYVSRQSRKEQKTSSNVKFWSSRASSHTGLPLIRLTLNKYLTLIWLVKGPKKLLKMKFNS